jgi:hypothetical protein
MWSGFKWLKRSSGDPIYMRHDDATFLMVNFMHILLEGNEPFVFFS